MGMDAAMRVYTPGEAAQTLGITTNTLRRYAEDYTDVFEAIPQRGRQRVFDDSILERLRTAQALQHANRAPSVLAALEMVRDGLESPDDLATPKPPPFEEAVLNRLAVLAEMVTQLHAENTALHDRLNVFEAPRENTEKRAALEAENADLRQRNIALLGELERRRTKTVTPQRPWWRVWGRT